MTAIPLFNLHHLAMAVFAASAAPAMWIKCRETGKYLWANPAADDIMSKRVEGAATEDLFGSQTAEVLAGELAAIRTGRDRRVHCVNGHPVMVQRFPVQVSGKTLISGVAIRMD